MDGSEWGGQRSSRVSNYWMTFRSARWTLFNTPLSHVTLTEGDDWKGPSFMRSSGQDHLVLGPSCQLFAQPLTGFKALLTH